MSQKGTGNVSFWVKHVYALSEGAMLLECGEIIGMFPDLRFVIIDELGDRLEPLGLTEDI